VPQNSQDRATRVLSTGDLIPQITVQLCNDSDVVWSSDLMHITDDLESQYLAAKANSFTFTLQVKDKGPVEGVLWSAFQTFTAPVSSTHSTVLCSRLAKPQI
jgi:hypothetical protein